MTTSISGLVSGLDTVTVINQLMELEATSQNRLKSQQSAQKTMLSALQALNTDTALLAGKAESLAKPATWQTFKATSTSPLVTVTAGATARPSSFAITVDRVATAGQTVFANTLALDTAVVTGTPVTLTAADGTTHELDTGTGTLRELADAINAAKSGVTATTVRTGPDAYRLQLTADTTGDGSAISLTNVDGLGAANAVAGHGAQISIGSMGIVATSSTNTFAEIAPGLSLTIAASAVGSLDAPVGTSATTSSVTVAQDPAGVKASVSALVDQLNALLAKIDAQAVAGTKTTSAGTLAGDATARSLRNNLLNSVFGSDKTSMASVGIQTDRSGKLVFDGDAFTKAYDADPVAVAAKFTTGATTGDTTTPDGWAARLHQVAKTASNSTTGTITSAITGRQSSIEQLGDNIDAWDLRLELRRTTLTRTYTALETSLSALQSQGNWLTSQLNALSSSS